MNVRAHSHKNLLEFYEINNQQVGFNQPSSQVTHIVLFRCSRRVKVYLQSKVITLALLKWMILSIN